MLRKPVFGHRHAWLLAALLCSLAACKSARRQATPWEGKDVGSFPYHPLIYHLDLCVLSYQLYAQTLIWPFDPYYEELNNWSWDRTKYMAKVRDWAHVKGIEQVRESAGLGGYRGPGSLGGFADNPHHDPILFRYDGLHPWSYTITNAEGGDWTEYLAPAEITGRIGKVYMCYRKTGEPTGAVSLEEIPNGRAEPEPKAGDVLLAFEGGTGDKGEPGRPPSQSLMGVVLLRTKAGGGYDVHVTFRGSRSGSAGRAVRYGMVTRDASGNPDWITDLGYDRLGPEAGGAHISTTGEVSRGFAHATESVFPQLFRCLEEVADIQDGAGPDHVYVTGHSLGGALAQHFVSAVLLGDRFGPGGAGSEMPAALLGWPWKEIKLITYAAPRAGNKRWARTLTESGLDAEFFSTWITPLDHSALGPGDPLIVTRLLDADGPAGYRVLISSDPVTTEKFVGGKHVGKTVYLNRPAWFDYLPRPDINSHKPQLMREFMVDCMPDRRTPASPWRELRKKELNPDGGGGNAAEELRKRALALERYYTENGVWFDQAAFDRDVELRFSIDRGE